jgi:DNA-binding transcriptional regulator LsrR (DeoR family)
MKVRDLEDWQVFRCCELFLDPIARPSPTAVAKILSREWGTTVRHTHIYPIVAEGRRRGIAHLVAPLDVKWSEAVARRFRHPKESIRVSAARGGSSLPAVSEAAADHIFDLIVKLGKSKPTVHVGLVGGRTVMAVMRDLALRLRHAEGLPKLVFHAIVSGYDALNPDTAPISFFGFFADVPTKVEYVGLFAPPIVDAKDYERVKNMRGVVESFRKAEEIDVVVTSLASAADRHGPLKDLQDVSEHGFGDLREAKVVGDVSYCPYSADGPILLDAGPRAMTLFQIFDLVGLAARRDKHVVLVASPCPGCDRLRADALIPLLESRSLKVWSIVFLDAETASEIIRLRGEPEGD